MFTFLRLSAVLLITCCLQAAEQPPVDEDLPQPFELNSKVLNDMRAHSPFNRFVSLEDTIQLTGVAYIQGKPMATLVNKDTKQRFVVSEEPNALGWTLTGATVSDELHKTEVHVMIGGEEVVMHYGDMMTASSAKKAASSRSRSAGGDAVNMASLLGKKGESLLKALSPEGREKLTGIVQASADKHPERSAEDNAALAQKIYTKMKASEDKAQSGASKSPSGSKPPKKK
jgi:hypothetical protein